MVARPRNLGPQNAFLLKEQKLPSHTTFQQNLPTCFGAYRYYFPKDPAWNTCPNFPVSSAKSAIDLVLIVVVSRISRINPWTTMHGDQMLRQWQLRKLINSNVLQYLQAIVETANLHVSCMPQLGTASFVSDAFLSEYSLRRSSFSCKILSQSPLESLKSTSCSLCTNNQRVVNNQLLLAVESNTCKFCNPFVLWATWQPWGWRLHYLSWMLGCR